MSAIRKCPDCHRVCYITSTAGVRQHTEVPRKRQMIEKACDVRYHNDTNAHKGLYIEFPDD